MTKGTSTDSLLDRLILNPAQHEAVAYDDGPQLVFAGAGTGKTRVLTAKIAYLIEEKGIAPDRLFAATFTNKAAREMKSRVESLTGLPCQGLWIGTFHSLCVRILRRESQRIDYSSWFTIYDDDDQAALMRAVLKQLRIEERAMSERAARSVVSHWKNRCVTPEQALRDASSYQQQQAVRVYRAYQQALRDRQAMDFDDLLSNAVYLLRDHADILERYRTRFQYVLVDEYQDTNHAQFRLVKLLTGTGGRVFAVGDDDQSIYGWRGAQIENILSFEREFRNTRTFRLEQNYRSTPAILAFANAAIGPNANRAPKRLWTSRTGSADVVVSKYADDRREAEAIGRSIDGLIRGGTRPSDIMVLYRTNAQSRPFEDAFRRQRIAYTLVGGISFYQRKEIKDCLGYLRLLVNPKDDLSFERVLNVPARGIGPKARQQLLSAASPGLLEAVLREPSSDAPPIMRHKGIVELRAIYRELVGLVEQGEAPSAVLRQMLTQTGYLTMLEAEDTDEAEGRIENINELLNALAIWSEENPDGTLQEFLEEVALVADIDTLDNERDSVTMMTLHSAKGLEAAHVFIAGLEDGLLPSSRNTEDPAKLEEERRLFYVGITRARDALHCSYTERRWRFGNIVPMQCSRFMQAIPTDCYSLRDESIVFESAATAPQQRGARAGKRREPRRELVFDEFSQEEVQLRMGQHVRHKTYGTGKILNVSGFGDDTRVTVLFNDGTRRRMLARFANLEVL